MMTPRLTRRQMLEYIAAGTVGSLLSPVPASAWPGETERIKLRFAILSDLHYPVNDDIAATYPTTLNGLDPHADFVVINGDLVNDDAAFDWKTLHRDYDKFTTGVWADFIRYADRIQAPIRPVIGNHDFFFPEQRWEGYLADLHRTEPRLTTDFDRYVSRCWGGRFDRCYYDWEQAGWCFMVLACGSDAYMERIGFFKWFEDRMRANAGRRTMIFMHVPPLSIGMCDSYFTTITQKAYFLDAFAKHGAIHSVFSGHIHNSTMVSMHSARTHGGTQYIVVPQHIWNQRPFGHHQKLDIEYRTRNHGFLCVTIDQNDHVRMSSCFPGNEETAWPATFPPQTYKNNPINFKPIAALPAVESDLAFTPDLGSWSASFDYTEPEHPSVARQVGDNGDMVLTLRGRAEPNEDFQLLPLNNVLYQMLPRRGTAPVTLEGEYQIEACQFGRTTLTEALDPDLFQNRQWAIPLFRPPWYYNIGFCGLAMFRGDKPLADAQMLFGQWSTDRKPAAPNQHTGDYGPPGDEWNVDPALPPQPGAWDSLFFAMGEYAPPPGKSRLVTHQHLVVGQRQRFRIVLPESPPPDASADKVLVVVGLSCDNMAGRLLRVRFGALRLTQG